MKDSQTEVTVKWVDTAVRLPKTSQHVFIYDDRLQNNSDANVGKLAWYSAPTKTFEIISHDRYGRSEYRCDALEIQCWAEFPVNGTTLPAKPPESGRFHASCGWQMPTSASPTMAPSTQIPLNIYRDDWRDIVGILEELSPLIPHEVLRIWRRVKTRIQDRNGIA